MALITVDTCCLYNISYRRRNTPAVGETFVVVESISESLLNLRLLIGNVAVGCLLNLVLVNLAVTNCVILLVVLDLRNGRVVAVPLKRDC